MPAMVLVDAVARLLPGVLGDKNSLNFESFEGNLLEYAHYTRPADYRGMKVPAVLVDERVTQHGSRSAGLDHHAVGSISYGKLDYFSHEVGKQ